MAESYCKLCGNEKTASEDRIGEACRELITGPLARPYAYWVECGERNRQCCGGLGTEKDHLYFHGKHWECRHQPFADNEELGVGVEMGVSFYVDRAETYYVRDFDHYVDSEEYGESIPYPAGVTEEGFWEKLDKQLDGAAEAAFNGDLLTCTKCGYHYIAGNEVCCEGEEEEDGDDN